MSTSIKQGHDRPADIPPSPNKMKKIIPTPCTFKMWVWTLIYRKFIVDFINGIIFEFQGLTFENPICEPWYNRAWSTCISSLIRGKREQKIQNSCIEPAYILLIIFPTDLQIRTNIRPIFFLVVPYIGNGCISLENSPNPHGNILQW